MTLSGNTRFLKACVYWIGGTGHYYFLDAATAQAPGEARFGFMLPGEVINGGPGYPEDVVYKMAIPGKTASSVTVIL